MTGVSSHYLNNNSRPSFFFWLGDNRAAVGAIIWNTGPRAVLRPVAGDDTFTCLLRCWIMRVMIALPVRPIRLGWAGFFLFVFVVFPQHDHDVSGEGQTLSFEVNFTGFEESFDELFGLAIDGEDETWRGSQGDDVAQLHGLSDLEEADLMVADNI